MKECYCCQGNLIKSTKGLQLLRSLEELDLRCNLIASIHEVVRLSGEFDEHEPQLIHFLPDPNFTPAQQRLACLHLTEYQWLVSNIGFITCFHSLRGLGALQQLLSMISNIGKSLLTCEIVRGGRLDHTARAVAGGQPHRVCATVPHRCAGLLPRVPAAAAGRPRQPALRKGDCRSQSAGQAPNATPML